MRYQKDDMDAWLATRPPSVQQLAQEFPVGTLIPKELTALFAKQYFVFGYTEDDHLVITCVDPTEDYYQAMDYRLRLCARHLRALAE